MLPSEFYEVRVCTLQCLAAKRTVPLLSVKRGQLSTQLSPARPTTLPFFLVSIRLTLEQGLRPPFANLSANYPLLGDYVQLNFLLASH